MAELQVSGEDREQTKPSSNGIGSTSSRSSSVSSSTGTITTTTCGTLGSNLNSPSTSRSSSESHLVEGLDVGLGALPGGDEVDVEAFCFDELLPGVSALEAFPRLLEVPAQVDEHDRGRLTFPDGEGGRLDDTDNCHTLKRQLAPASSVSFSTTITDTKTNTSANTTAKIDATAAAKIDATNFTTAVNTNEADDFLADIASVLDVEVANAGNVFPE